MAKIFKNTDNKFSDEVGLHLDGWDSTIPYGNQRIAHITDTVGAGIALAKMGTSIPTPFARMLIFNAAFAQVNSPALGHDSDSVYGKLVSECLDFLEFLFNYGNRIDIKRWNVEQEINNLRASTSKKHNALADSMEKFIRDLQVKDIYLFYYDNVLIGGSSPYTLVYTSPNWQRIKPISNARGLKETHCSRIMPILKFRPCLCISAMLISVSSLRVILSPSLVWPISGLTKQNSRIISTRTNRSMTP